MWCREYVITTVVVHRRPIAATRTFISMLIVVVSSSGDEDDRHGVHLGTREVEPPYFFFVSSSPLNYSLSSRKLVGNKKGPMRIILF